MSDYEPTEWAPHEEFKEREDGLHPKFPRLPCETMTTKNKIFFPVYRDSLVTSLHLFLKQAPDKDDINNI